jgi:hypothetical protein
MSIKLASWPAKSTRAQVLKGFSEVPAHHLAVVGSLTNEVDYPPVVCERRG